MSENGRGGELEEVSHTSQLRELQFKRHVLILKSWKKV